MVSSLGRRGGVRWKRRWGCSNLRSRCGNAGPSQTYWTCLLLMSTLSTLPALFKHPHLDAKWGKEAAFKGSIWLPSIFHWCIVTGDFPPPLLPRTGSETEPDVHVFTDTSAPSWCLAALLASAAAACSWSWMLRLLWHDDSNDNDRDFYGHGINNRWGWWLKSCRYMNYTVGRMTGNQLWSIILFTGGVFISVWMPWEANILKSKVMKWLWTCTPTSTSVHHLIMWAAECLIASPVMERISWPL